MKIVKIKVEGLPLFKETLEIDFFAQQRVGAGQEESMYKLFSYGNSNIYLNNVISLVGINASGKTTILRVLAFVIEMINHKSINDITNNKILDGLAVGKTVLFKTYFYCENGTLNKIETLVRKCNDSLSRENNYIIDEERAWIKPVSKIRTKKNMFEFEESDLALVRDKEEEFLLDDVSISMAVLKRNKDKKMFFLDMLDLTNHTLLKLIGNYPIELIEFLDPSIEWLKFEEDEKGIESEKIGIIHLKFKGKEEILLRNLSELSYYLSSGTIKGINIFMNAVFTFRTSGYMIVDEIENHFNKEIVATLIRFFMNNKVNRNGGTLIFSTHYAELLDEFNRNDSIYIIRNREGISAENLSQILTRNDIKKSEAYESGFLEGTVPMYDSYMRLKKCLMSEV